MQSRWRHSVTEPHTRWRICVTMVTLWQQQDGGYMLFYIFNSTVVDWTCSLFSYLHRWLLGSFTFLLTELKWEYFSNCSVWGRARPLWLSKGDVKMYGQAFVTSGSLEYFGNFDKVINILVHFKVWTGWCRLWKLDVFSSRYWLLLILPRVTGKVTDTSRGLTASFRK